MKRQWLKLVFFLLTVNHFTSQVLSLGFLGARREAGVTMKNHVIVRADAFAGVGAAAASASLAEYLTRAMKYFQTSFGAVPFLELGGEVRAHAEQLANKLQQVNYVVWNNSVKPPIIPRVTSVQQPITDTAFEQLMIAVLKDSKPNGCSVVHAEPGIGKSVATALAVQRQTSKFAIQVLLQGDFTKNVRDFFRVSDPAVATDVAWALFPLLKRQGIRLQIIFDNTFDGGVGIERSTFMDLIRAAFAHGHHFIVVVQSTEAANQVADLNGARTRQAPQQREEERVYRWDQEQAKMYLERGKEQQLEGQLIEEVLNMAQVPDDFGRWKPVDIDEYLQTGRVPSAPRRAGQGSAASQPSAAVWVCQLGSPDGKPETVGSAFKITASVSDVDDLKEAIKQKKPNTVSCDADELDIYSRKDGRWVKETRMSSSLRNTDEADCYGFMLPAGAAGAT